MPGAGFKRHALRARNCLQAWQVLALESVKRDTVGTLGSMSLFKIEFCPTGRWDVCTEHHVETPRGPQRTVDGRRVIGYSGDRREHLWRYVAYDYSRVDRPLILDVYHQ